MSIAAYTMDAYTKEVNVKLSKLAIVDDDDRHDEDPNLNHLIARAFKYQLDETLEESDYGQRGSVTSIHDYLSKERLTKLRQEFLAILKDTNSGLNLEQFKTAMAAAVKIKLNVEKIEELFFKVDVMKNETVTWEAYSNYLLLEMDQKEKLYRMEKELLGDNILFLKTEGRDSIKSLFIVPSGDFDSSDAKGLAKDADCKYFTCSRDGVMSFWSYNFQSVDTYSLHSFVARGTILSFWVTAAEFMPDARLLIVATTNFNMYIFHHGINKEFELNSRIEKFPATIVCLSYQKDETTGTTSFLTWGDEHGGVGVIFFHVNPGKTAVGMSSKNNFNKKNRIQELHFTDLSNNHVVGLEARYIGDIHHRYVCQVRYVTKLHSWLTCAKDTCTALYVGDLVPNVAPKNRKYYSVVHGVTVFEYCEKMNFIITGGCDMLIRLWNPMAKGNKLVGVFRGHVSPITHLMLDMKDLYLISIGESKDVLIYEMVDQICIQKIKQYKLKKLGQKHVTAACMNKMSHTVVMASNMRLAVIEGKEDGSVKKSLITDSVPITAALYNPLFKQIVTGDWRSQVLVWNAATGSKEVHYTAHTIQEKGKQIEVDIKVMSFDSTFRRLITGHRDGMVKIWNYNVGVLLQELPVPNRSEITSICCPPGKIFVACCSNEVLLHVEKKYRKDYVALKPSHPDNITQIAILQDTYLASASVDGTLIVYSLKNHFPQFKFNMADVSAPATVDFYHGMTLEQTDSDSNWNPSSSKKILKLFGAQRKDTSGRPSVGKHKSTNMSRNSLYYTYCVEALVFLSTRELTKDTAALLTCMHNGKVLAWSMNLYGRCLGEFLATHTENEILHSADVTRDDEFLVTGDSLGYIKVWDISHYYNPAVGECSPMLDSQRMPVWETFSYVRMRREIQPFVQKYPDANLPIHMKIKCDWSQPGQEQMPHLINSFKSHTGSVVCIKLVQINESQMIITTSTDLSVRLWSLEGIFIGVLGQKSMWTNPEIVFGLLPNGRQEIERLAAIRKQDTKPCPDSVVTTMPFVASTNAEKSNGSSGGGGSGGGVVGSGGGTVVLSEDDAALRYMDHYVKVGTTSLNLDRMLADIESRKSAAKISLVTPQPDVSGIVSSSILSVETQVSESKFQLLNVAAEKMPVLMDQQKRKNIVRTDIPQDLKRTGSYTTLYVLESEMNIRGNSRWTKIRHATVWIVNFLKSRKMKSFIPFSLARADQTKVGVYSNNIKDMIEEHLSTVEPSTSEARIRSDSMAQRSEQDKKNYLMRPLTPLSSEIFGPFYCRHYTRHRPIVPWKVSEERSKKVCPHKHLTLATFPASDPASTIKEIFNGLGVQIGSNTEVLTPHAATRAGGFQPFTESEMILVKNLHKTGWKLMSDGTLARRKVPLNSSKTNSYLPPLLISEMQVRDGVKNKGEICFSKKNKGS